MKEDYLRHLFKIAPNHSKEITEATIDHLCHGLSQDKAAEKHHTVQSSVGRTVSKIRKLDLLIKEAIIIKIS